MPIHKNIEEIKNGDNAQKQKDKNVKKHNTSYSSCKKEAVYEENSTKQRNMIYYIHQQREPVKRG